MKAALGMDASGHAYDPKPQHGGGVIVLAGLCRDHEGVVVAEADGKILAQSRGRAARPSKHRHRRARVRTRRRDPDHDR